MHIFQLLLTLVVLFLGDGLFAQAVDESASEPDSRVLSAGQWKQLDESVEKGLAWLATQQQNDGSFKSISQGQPAVTALGVMAFLAQGESPTDGEYRQQLAKAIDFIASQQKANGLIETNAPNAVPIPRSGDLHSVAIPAVYNHSISALAICEAYGQCNTEQAKKLTPVIEKAIAATLEMQGWKRERGVDKGGWRYLVKQTGKPDADLSVTGWQLMFLRSARNAGFDVPEESIDVAVSFIEKCFLNDPDRKIFSYLADRRETCTRAMAGAGVLALAHAGKHNSEEAIAAGKWILTRDFTNYNAQQPIYGYPWLPDRYHYGAALCSQAMFQLGGKFWREFFPPLVDTLLANQNADGSWPPEKSDERYGSCYSTSLCILSLSVPNQILPIFQR